MLVLEKLHQFLGKLRELSVMFSPWWTRSSDIQQVGNQPERLLHSRKSASFRLSTSVTPDVSKLESMKSSKKKSKHKRLKSKRHSLELPDSMNEITKSQLGSRPPEVESDRKSSGKKKDSCRVINLKIPLPDDAAFLLSRHYYYNPYRDYPPALKGNTAQEESSLGGKTARKKGGLGRSSEPDEQQPTLSEFGANELKYTAHIGAN